MNDLRATKQDPRFQQLRKALEAMIIRVTPLTQDEINYAKSIDDWMEDSKRFGVEATRLAQEGRMREAKAILDMHNAQRPRMKRGRHRVLSNMPSGPAMDAALLCALANYALNEIGYDTATRKELLRNATLFVQAASGGAN